MFALFILVWWTIGLFLLTTFYDVFASAASMNGFVGVWAAFFGEQSRPRRARARARRSATKELRRSLRLARSLLTPEGAWTYATTAGFQGLSTLSFSMTLTKKTTADDGEPAPQFEGAAV